jgi:TldD protein
MAVAGDGMENQSGWGGPGGQQGFEFFESHDPAVFGRDAARTAVTMLRADRCPAGPMTVAIENGFGGVLFHEACGHALEATAVAKGHSVFAGRLEENRVGRGDGRRRRHHSRRMGLGQHRRRGDALPGNVLIEKGILKVIW